MIIRQAHPSDLSDLIQLHAESWRSVYRGTLSEDYLADQVVVDLANDWEGVSFEGQDLVLVAEDDTGLIGLMKCLCRPDPFIDNLHVKPDLKAQGVGRALMVETMQRLREMGHSQMSLLVLENNTSARRFYQKMGGQEVGTVASDLLGRPVTCLRILWSTLDG